MRYIPFLLILALFGCMSDTDKRDEFFQSGNDALDRGAFKDAIDHFTNALKADPAYAEALNNRGVAQIESGHPYEALLDYNQALSIRLDYDECRLNRSYAFEFIGQYENALKDISYLSDQSPDSAYLHFYKGLVLTKMRSYRDALNSFNRAISLGMDQGESQVNVGTIYFFLGENDSAKYFLDKVLSQNPRDPNALNTMSQLYLTENDYPAALYAIEQALEVVPNEPFFINNRGLVYIEMDSLERGLKDVNQSIILNPGNGWAYRNKGIYHLKKGEYTRALELFQRAIDSKEFIDELYYYIGSAHIGLNQNEAACEAWKKGVENGERRSAIASGGC
jgi:tetratricopeptide (TPR) repeat protein